MWNLNRVKKIKYTSGYSFLIVFDDGTQATIDFSDYLKKGPIFAPLQNLTFFQQAKVEGGGQSLGPMARTLHQKPSTKNANRCPQFDSHKKSHS